MVIVIAVATNVNHRIDRTGTAEHLAAWPVELAMIELRLLICVVGPIAGCLKHFTKGDGDVCLLGIIRATGFKKKDCCLRVFGQAISEYTTCGTCSDDNIIVHGSFL